MATTAKILMMAGAMAALITGPVMAQPAVSPSQVMTTTTMKSVTVTQKQIGPDADMAMLLKEFASLKPKPIETLTPEEARKQPTMADAVAKMLKDQRRKAPSTSDIEKDTTTYTNAKGDKLNVNIYYPKAKGQTAQQIRPMIVYFHGGGWVIANVKVYESSIIALARKTGAVVIAPEYRMGPEDKFPAAHEDAFAAYQWALVHAKDYDGDAKRVAVVGESAGGNLAANVGIMARDAHLPMPVALGLIYPVAGTDMATPSYQQNEFAKPLNKAMMAWFMNNISSQQDRAKVMADPRLDLVHAKLAGLPPTTVITADIDPLRSDGEMLAQSLQSEGVKTSYRNYEGVTHEFFGADAVLKDARAAQDFMAMQLKAAFAAK